jgi:hypothetical protein
MNQFKITRRFMILLFVIAITAVACSGQSASDSDQVAVDSAQPTTPAVEEPATSEAEEPAESEVEAPAPAAADTAGDLSFEWKVTQVGEGIKPAIDVDAAGVVHIAFLTEADHGGVFYGNNASGDFEFESVSEGYFYGPLDLALGPNGAPYIAYHDHQDINFKQELGDEVVAILSDGRWDLVTVKDAGHDGWDNSITVDDSGNWHTAAVDPSQFGGQSGVEYATNAGGSVSVVEVGSGPIVYEFATSIQLDPDNLPAVAYYDNNVQGLAYAKFDGDDWTVAIVDDDGDAGRYASLAFDNGGAPHISYFVFDGATSGTVRHAWLDGGEWIIEDVDSLNDVQPGQIGARKITALTFDESGTAHIAYTDRGRIVYGQRSENGRATQNRWVTQEVPQLTDGPLGQLVELAVDGEGKPHLTWFEVASQSPLSGPIVYASPSSQ